MTFGEIKDMVGYLERAQAAGKTLEQVIAAARKDMESAAYSHAQTQFASQPRLPVSGITDRRGNPLI